jgi:hypothetical protein
MIEKVWLTSMLIAVISLTTIKIIGTWTPNFICVFLVISSISSLITFLILSFVLIWK